MPGGRAPSCSADLTSLSLVPAWKEHHDHGKVILKMRLVQSTSQAIFIARHPFRCPTMSATWQVSPELSCFRWLSFEVLAQLMSATTINLPKNKGNTHLLITGGKFLLLPGTTLLPLFAKNKHCGKSSLCLLHGWKKTWGRRDRLEVKAPKRAFKQVKSLPKDILDSLPCPTISWSPILVPFLVVSLTAFKLLMQKAHEIYTSESQNFGSCALQYLFIIFLLAAYFWERSKYVWITGLKLIQLE